MSPARARFGSRRVVARVIVTWLVASVALAVLGAILPGVAFASVGSAVLTAAVIGLINAFVWPLLIRVALPLSVLTLGLGALVLNGVVILVVARIAPGVTIRGLGTAIVVALGLTAITTAVTGLLAIDDDDVFYRHIIRRHARHSANSQPDDVPGVIFLEVDGLAHAVLQRALRDGTATTLARWLREGTHHLIPWECDWSSQTGACQAGLLHGNNDDMPAFRWWEKERQAPIVSNHPRDAMEIERRHSNGHGLLAFDGASRANLLSGDAPHSLLTMSTVLCRDRPGRLGQDYFAYFARPYNVTRTVVLVVADIAAEFWSAAQQRRRDVQPRVHRGLTYALVRSWTTVIQRDLQVQTVIGDIFAGRPVVYTTFLGYDEVAHHAGIERPETLAVLRRIDHQFARIERAAREGPRSYHLVVLADHGQTQGATFRQRYGQTLEELVRELTAAHDVEAQAQGTEGPAFLGASLTEAAAGQGAMAAAVRRMSSRHVVDGAVVLGEEPHRTGDRQDGDGAQVPEVVVMASGCLGLVSFARKPGRVSLECLEELYPRLLPALCEHPGVGFLLVRSEQHGALVMGARGINYLDAGRVEGEDPLAPFGPNAAATVRRVDGFPHCPDIMVNSTYWAETDEVAAFEELVGSHGGMGGSQAVPFVLYPASWPVPEDSIVGAEVMHRQLRCWLAVLGQVEHAIAPDLPPAGAAQHRGETTRAATTGRPG
jgi:uncharacterized membrane protein YvlD (DUF360 family)